MVKQTEISGMARMLPKKRRGEILMSFPEKELHEHLKTLLGKMEPNAVVEITHGQQEYGKDLVMVREDQFGRATIALIVQMGHIRGATLGNVDKIISQVRQAFDHRVRLKTVAEELNISEAWVTLAGVLSVNAHKRLEEELKGRSIRIFDLNWLVENFTRDYPQVFFAGKLIDFLQEKIQTFEKKH